MGGGGEGGRPLFFSPNSLPPPPPLPLTLLVIGGNSGSLLGPMWNENFDLTLAHTYGSNSHTQLKNVSDVRNENCVNDNTLFFK